MIPKHKPIRSQKLRDSANGEECFFQIPGVCSFDPEKTVLCHLPFETHGMGQKACDVSAAFGDDSCHSIIDGRVPYDWKPGEKEYLMRRAMVRTWRRWIEMGLVKIG